MWAAIKVIITYLPDLIELVKAIVQKTNEGIETAVLKRRLRTIRVAFKMKDRSKAAELLNDQFRK